MQSSRLGEPGQPRVSQRMLGRGASVRPILGSVLRLVTIPISHYCEKARWALERAGIPYHEERHVQGIHRIAARRAGGGATVPVLVTPDGGVGESEEILAWVDERTPPELRLFPDDLRERAEVERLCRRFDEGLGPRGRRLMYIHMLPQRELTLRFNNQACRLGRIERFALHGRSPCAGCGASSRSDPESRTRMKPLCGASSTSSPSCSPTANTYAASDSVPPT